MFKPFIGEYDPYDTLKTLHQEVQELKEKYEGLKENQKVIDAKLDEILRAVTIMPDKNIETPYSWSSHDKAEHGKVFDEDHKGGEYKEKSQQIKALLRRLHARKR